VHATVKGSPVYRAFTIAIDQVGCGAEVVGFAIVQTGMTDGIQDFNFYNLVMVELRQMGKIINDKKLERGFIPQFSNEKI